MGTQLRYPDIDYIGVGHGRQLSKKFFRWQEFLTAQTSTGTTLESGGGTGMQKGTTVGAYGKAGALIGLTGLGMSVDLAEFSIDIPPEIMAEVNNASGPVYFDMKNYVAPGVAAGTLAWRGKYLEYDEAATGPNTIDGALLAAFNGLASVNQVLNNTNDPATHRTASGLYIAKNTLTAGRGLIVQIDVDVPIGFVANSVVFRGLVMRYDRKLT